MYLRRTLIVILVLALGLAACGPAGAPATVAPDPEADPQPGADPEPPEADQERLAQAEMVVYSGRSQSLVGPILEQFEAETGIEVAVRWGQTAEVAATILEEGDNSPADLFFAQDPGGLGALSERFTQLPQETLDRVDPRFRDPASRWVGVSGRARVLVYNTEAVPEADLPTDLWGLTDPEWQGRLGWAPTNASFQTMVTAMRAQWGDEQTRDWLNQMLANDPEVYDGNTPIVAATGSGEIEVGLVNHYYLYRFLEEEGESFSARNHFLPEGGPGSLVMVSGVGVLESSDNKEVAFELVNYLLSEEAQRYFSQETFEYPLAAGVPAQPELTPLSELNAAEIDLSNLADLAGTLELLREVGALP